jgi:hypothetical protein
VRLLKHLPTVWHWLHFVLKILAPCCIGINCQSCVHSFIFAVVSGCAVWVTDTLQPRPLRFQCLDKTVKGLITAGKRNPLWYQQEHSLEWPDRDRLAVVVTETNTLNILVALHSWTSRPWSPHALSRTSNTA